MLLLFWGQTLQITEPGLLVEYRVFMSGIRGVEYVDQAASSDVSYESTESLAGVEYRHQPVRQRPS